MITEDYVSFETAKLLKEKGFPQEYDRYHSLVYNEEDYEDEYEVERMITEAQGKIREIGILVMTIIEQIKAEIERLIEESDFDESANLYSLLSFLDTLEEPEVVNNLTDDPIKAVRLPDGR